MEPAHRGTRKPSSGVCLSVGRLPVGRGIFRACSGHGLQPHTAFTVRLPAPSAAGAVSVQGSLGDSVCGTDREGGRAGGAAPMEGGGLQLFSKRDRRSSLLLLGRSGGSRYERSSSGFVSSGRSWKRSAEAQVKCQSRGQVAQGKGCRDPRPVHVPSACLRGPWPKWDTLE